jgi:hypothetical protein
VIQGKSDASHGACTPSAAGNRRIQNRPLIGFGSQLIPKLLIDLYRLLYTVVQHGMPLTGMLVQINRAKQKTCLNDDFQSITQLVSQSSNLQRLLGSESVLYGFTHEKNGDSSPGKSPIKSILMR